ncbi:GNAT family N-acetyltransferase [Bacillus sp. BHET2]|uniref:GNAT family N-acetyltransferase n=1 Tax=Bacillus sp. BHET2 TaxID=2583818 RepID=UPI00110F1262|nr:GNAT family N-acetyltransferase [Bacillus sp. BHET2]TMU87038.1 GNAT family N-acetyltransferase [Bacillus sp. BHET2]
MIKIEGNDNYPSIKQLLSYSTSNAEHHFEKYLQSPSGELFALEHEGEMVGCIGVEFIGLTTCEIKHLAVSPRVRGRGMASEMIQNIIDMHKVTNVLAETDKDAVLFYQKFGFTIISLGEKYPGVERFLCEYSIDRR